MSRALLVAPAVVLLAACVPAPSGPTVSISPETPTTTDDLVASWEGAADDPEGVTFSVQWSVDGEPVGDLSGQDTVPSLSTAKGQEWQVSVTPVNREKLGPSARVSVVIANTPPTADVTFRPEVPTTSDDLEVVLDVHEPDEEHATPRYAWTVDGAAIGITESRVPDTATVKGQVWEVSVYLRDEEGENPAPSVGTVTVVNTPASVDRATVLPSNPDKHDTLSCEGTGWEDDDGDPESYLVSWEVDDLEISTEATLDGEDLERGERVVCVLTPDDGEELGAAVSSAAVSFGNTQPIVHSVTIGPEDPIDTVTATIDATDPDGDEVSFLYEWTVEGVVEGEDAELRANRFDKGDEIQLEVIPFDGLDQGVPVSSNVITGGNHPPAISSVALDPDPVYTDDLLVASPNTSDKDDGDTLDLTYTWYVEGTAVSETSDTLDGDTWFDKGEDVYVEVTADDGTDTSGAVASSTLTVSNSPPTDPELDWDTTDPDPSSDLQCVIDTESTDADDDTITYTFSWEADGVALSGATTTDHTGDTLPAGSWEEGDDLRCYVTADDGTDSSGEVQIRAGIAPPCDSADATTVYDSNGRWYVFCNDLLDFADAWDACLSMGGTWDLASVTSSAETAFLNTEASAAISNSAGNPFGWIGFNDLDTEGSWEWTDGSSTTYTNWGKGEPNGGASKDCAMFRAGGSYGGDWNDIDCSNTQPYICSEP